MKYLKVFVDFADKIELLGDAERGRLFTAMLEYASSGAEPDLRGNERFIWPTAKSEIDRQSESYKARCETNRNNAASRYDSQRFVTSRSDSHQDKDKDKDKDYISPPPPLPRKVPTFDEVAEYAKLRGGLIDPKPFYEFYSVSGWRDTEGKPVYNWQQKFQLWEKRELEKKGGAMNGYGHDTGGDTKKWNVPGAVNL